LNPLAVHFRSYFKPKMLEGPLNIPFPGVVVRSAPNPLTPRPFSSINTIRTNKLMITILEAFIY
jgi:hypothetical protein